MPNDPQDETDFNQASKPTHIQFLGKRFAQSLNSRQPARIESLLAEATKPERSALLDELLSLELEFRLQNGEAPNSSEYSQRFPDDTEVLSEVFARLVSSATITISLSPKDNTASIQPDDPNSTVILSTGITSASSGADPVIGSNFGDYQILAEIARGGMGVVYKARQKKLNRIVALKMILAGRFASEDDVKRFYSEAEAAAKLEHPGIVPIFEVAENGGKHFFSMGYVEGESLAAIVTRDGLLPPRKAAKLVCQIAEAIDFAHQRGVIHRDLKPSNVLLDVSGHPKVTDFGLAKQTEGGSDLTQSGQILGTPSYMPPEQAAGEHSRIGPQSDVYSVGAILYFLLTGRPPFQSYNMMSTLKQVLEQEPVSPRQLNNEVDADLETICLKCLEKSPERRYESAAALVEELNRLLRGEPIRARRISQTARIWRWCRRKPLAAGLIVASATAVLFLVVGLSYRRSFEDARQIADQAQQLARSAEQLAKSAESVAEAEKRAAAAEKYVSLIQQVREKSVTRKWGWTWEAVELLKQAAAIETPLADPVELRSLTATVLSAFDLQEIGIVASEISSNAIAFSPDGKRLAVGQTKHGLVPTVYVYDVETQQLESSYSFSNLAKAYEKLSQGIGVYHDGYRSLAFSSDGRWLAGGTRFGRIVCWDTEADKPVAKMCEAMGDTDEIWKLMFSPDDDALVACCPHSQEVRLWRFQESLTATAPDFNATDIAVLPYDRTLAALIDETLRIYDLKTLQPVDLKSPQADEQEPTDPLFRPLVTSRDGYTLVCGSEQAVRFLNPVTGVEFFRFEQPDSSLRATYLYDMSFNAENEVLAMSGRGGSKAISFFSKRTGKLLGNLSEAGVYNAVFSPSGSHLAVRADKQVKLYRYRSRECTTTIAHRNTPYSDVRWNQSGSELTCLSEEDPVDEQQDRFLWQQITRWNANNGKLLDERTATTYRREPGRERKLLAQSSNDRSVTSILSGPGIWVTNISGPEFSGKPILAPNNNHYFEIPADDLSVDPAETGITVVEDSSTSNTRALRIPGSIKKWKVSLDIANLKLPRNVSEWAVYALIKIESPQNSGTRFVAGAQYGKRRIERHVPAMLFSASGYGLCWVEAFRPKHLKKEVTVFLESAASSSDMDALLIDRFVVVPSNEFDTKDHPVGPISLSRDGSQLWTVYGDEQLVSLHFPELEVNAKWSNAAAKVFSGRSSISSLAAGREWCLAGCGDGKLRVVKGGQLQAEFEGPGGDVLSIALADDEKTAVLGTDAGKLRIVDLPKGSTIVDLPDHDHEVISLELSQDGNVLISSSLDGSLRVWHRQADGFRLFARLPLDHPRSLVRLSPDGKRIAVLSFYPTAVLIWNLDQLNHRLTELGLPAPTGTR
jgi:WD40 repeat protein/tRNA A-37 threonylcarbamoyl transferase component Bud32